jgi:hypothetical protein
VTLSSDIQARTHGKPRCETQPVNIN